MCVNEKEYELIICTNTVANNIITIDHFRYQHPAYQLRSSFWPLC